MVNKLYIQDKIFLQRSQLREIVHLKELFSQSGLDSQDLFQYQSTRTTRGQAVYDEGLSDNIMDVPKRVNRQWTQHQLQFKDAHEFLNWLVVNLDKIHSPEEAVRISRYGELTPEDVQQISSGKYRIPRGRICAIPSDSKRSLQSRDVKSQQQLKSTKSNRKPQLSQPDDVADAATTNANTNGVTSVKSTQEHIDPFSHTTTAMPAVEPPKAPAKINVAQQQPTRPGDMSGQFNCWPQAMPSNPRDLRIQHALNQWPHMVGLPPVGPMFSYGQQPANINLLMQLQSNLALQQMSASMRACWPMTPLANMIGLQNLAGTVGYQGYNPLQQQFQREVMQRMDALASTWHGHGTRQQTEAAAALLSKSLANKSQTMHGVRSRASPQEAAADKAANLAQATTNVSPRVTRRRSQGSELRVVGEKRIRQEPTSQAPVCPPNCKMRASDPGVRQPSTGDTGVPRARRSIRKSLQLPLQSKPPQKLSRDSSEIPRWRRHSSSKLELRDPAEMNTLGEGCKRQRVDSNSNVYDEAMKPICAAFQIAQPALAGQHGNAKPSMLGSGCNVSDEENSGSRKPLTRSAKRQLSNKVDVDCDAQAATNPKISPTASTGHKSGVKAEVGTASSDNKDKGSLSQAGSEVSAGANWLIDALSPNDQPRIALSKLFQGNMHYWTQCSQCAHYTCTQQVFTEIPVHFQRQPPIAIPFGTLPTTTPFAHLLSDPEQMQKSSNQRSLDSTPLQTPKVELEDTALDTPAPSLPPAPKVTAKSKQKKRSGKAKLRSNGARPHNPPKRKPQVLEYYGSILQCLEGFEEVGYSCSKCHSQTAVRRYKPERAPDILIFQLFVFDFDQRAGDGTKLRYFAEVPESLNLGLVSGRDAQYDLRASVCHLGSNLSTGHYTVYVKHMEAYYYIDNQQVIPVKDKALMMYHLSTASYLVFYSKKADGEDAKLDS